MRTSFIRTLTVVLAGTLLAAGAVWIASRASRTPAPMARDGRLRIVTTILPAYDLVRAIGGDAVHVSLLLAPGVEPHHFDPSPRDAAAVADADLFVYVSDDMEAWVPRLLAGLGRPNLSVVASGAGLASLAETDEGDDHKGRDPHVWLDPMHMAAMADVVAEAMARLDAPHANAFRGAAAVYRRELERLDAEFRNGLSACRTRAIVQGGHFALGYLANRYGLTYRAAQGFTPDAEPTAKDLARLAQFVREEHIAYVFAEELVSPQVAETLAREAGAGVLTLTAAHTASRADLDAGVTYVDLMRRNLTALKTGLQCLQ